MSKENETIRVRALTQLYHGSRMYKPGDEFEYEGTLTGSPDEGMEPVNPETNHAFDVRRKEEISKAVKKAESLRAHHAKLAKQAIDKPGQVALAHKVIEADIAASDAEREAKNMQDEDNDLV